MKSVVQRKSGKGGRALPTQERQHSGIDDNFTAWPDVADPAVCSKTGLRLTLAVPLVKLRWDSALGRGIELPSKYRLCVSESGSHMSILLCSEAGPAGEVLIASIPADQVASFVRKAYWRLTNPAPPPKRKIASIADKRAAYGAVGSDCM